jgi:phosphate starvation-inducible PhoH-like protein
MRTFVYLVTCLLFVPLESFRTKFEPRNSRQQKFQSLIHDKDKFIIFGIGCAGTGKTLLSCQESLNLLFHKKVKKIVLTRPVVSVENEEIGFLPGTLEDKMSPWVRPLFDNLCEFYTPSEIKQMIKEDKIEICPLGFMRGRTFRDTVILVDEAQNTTPRQMKMVLTRIGENSKLILNGDIRQSDLEQTNGLEDIVCRLQQSYPVSHDMFLDGIAMVHFGNEHVLRHQVVEKIIRVYDEDGEDFTLS